MTESFGYYCLNHDVRFRISSFKTCWTLGILPCKDPLWGCGFYIYSQRFGGNPEVCFHITVTEFQTTGRLHEIFDESGTISEFRNRVDVLKSLAVKPDNQAYQERCRIIAKTLENALSGSSLTGWREPNYGPLTQTWWSIGQYTVREGFSAGTNGEEQQ